MTKFLLALIPAVVVVGVSIISVQNATPVSITFLAFRSVALPFGIWMGFGLAAGMIGTAAILTAFGESPRRS
jgi:uncharacterized integral membrane protein